MMCSYVIQLSNKYYLLRVRSDTHLIGKIVNVRKGDGVSQDRKAPLINCLWSEFQILGRDCDFINRMMK